MDRFSDICHWAQFTLLRLRPLLTDHVACTMNDEYRADKSSKSSPMGKNSSSRTYIIRSFTQAWAKPSFASTVGNDGKARQLPTSASYDAHAGRVNRRSTQSFASRLVGADKFPGDESYLRDQEHRLVSGRGSCREPLVCPDYLGRAVDDLAVTLQNDFRIPQHTGMSLHTGNPHRSP